MKTQFIFFFFALLTLLTTCQQNTSSNPSKITEGMIKVAILYPNDDEKTFDMDYYAQKHMPMVADLFGESLKLYTIEKGLSGRTPDEPMPYKAIGYFYFDKLSDYQNAFGQHAEKILDDIPNYTDIQPVVQISEVVH